MTLRSLQLPHPSRDLRWGFRWRTTTVFVLSSAVAILTVWIGHGGQLSGSVDECEMRSEGCACSGDIGGRPIHWPLESCPCEIAPEPEYGYAK